MATKNDVPLCSSPLNSEEALQLEINLMPLLRYLGSPGDWGYKTKLGILTIFLRELRAEIRQAAKSAAVDQEAS